MGYQREIVQTQVYGRLNSWVELIRDDQNIFGRLEERDTNGGFSTNDYVVESLTRIAIIMR